MVHTALKQSDYQPTDKTPGGSYLPGFCQTYRLLYLPLNKGTSKNEFRLIDAAIEDHITK